MDADFWHQVWREGRLGFHQPDGNATLKARWPALGLKAGARVLVPLCGKTPDLWWLAAQDQEVTGVELSPVACAAFFDEAGVTPTVSALGPHHRSWVGARADGVAVRLIEGDALTLPEGLRFDAAYDRAATVALPGLGQGAVDLRATYAERLAAALAPGAPVLLLVFTHDTGGGPPFSVPDAEVARCFGARFDPLALGARDSGPFREHAWRLTRR
jgi:thiopurine S-methyltransferase